MRKEKEMNIYVCALVIYCSILAGALVGAFVTMIIIKSILNGKLLKQNDNMQKAQERKDIVLESESALTEKNKVHEEYIVPSDFECETTAFSEEDSAAHENSAETSEKSGNFDNPNTSECNYKGELKTPKSGSNLLDTRIPKVRESWSEFMCDADGINSGEYLSEKRKTEDDSYDLSKLGTQNNKESIMNEEPSGACEPDEPKTEKTDNVIVDSATGEIIVEDTSLLPASQEPEQSKEFSEEQLTFDFLDNDDTECETTSETSSSSDSDTKEENAEEDDEFDIM